MSAPAQNPNGLPVRSSADPVAAPRARRARARASRSAARPSDGRLRPVLAVVDRDERERPGPVPRGGGGRRCQASALSQTTPRPCRGRCRARSARSGRSALAHAVGELRDRRMPVAASGWPQAIAPPYGLSRASSGSTPSPRHHVSTWTANGSFSSKRPMSSSDRPACASASLGRRHRADAHQVGLDAGVREGDEAKPRLEAELVGGLLRREQRGGRAVGQPGRVAGGDAAAGAGRASAAPASPSSVVSGRRNSSRSAIVQPLSVNTAIGTTVSAMTPFCQAAAARCCERRAKRVGVLARQLAGSGRGGSRPSGP